MALTKERAELIIRLKDGCTRTEACMISLVAEAKSFKVLEILDEYNIRGCEIHKFLEKVGNFELGNAVIPTMGIKALSYESFKKIVDGPEWTEEIFESFVQWTLSLYSKIFELGMYDDAVIEYFTANPPVQWVAMTSAVNDPLH